MCYVLCSVVLRMSYWRQLYNHLLQLPKLNSPNNLSCQTSPMIHAPTPPVQTLRHKVHNPVTGMHSRLCVVLFTSVMIYNCRASLSEQHTDLLICHSTKQDLSHTSRYLGIAGQQPGQLQKHELSFTLKSWAEFLTFICAVLCVSLNPRQSWLKFVLPVATYHRWSVANRSKLPCVLQLQLSQLQVTDAAL